MKPSNKAIETLTMARQSIVDYNLTMEAILELTKLKSKQYKAVFDQLKAEGFTNQEALELLKARGEFL